MNSVYHSEVSDACAFQIQCNANAAWNVNENSAGIPFSVAASVLTRGSGAKSKQQETSGNPAHGSLAGNPSSDTSTTTMDD